MTDADIAPELSILVISYNTREMTLACLDSVIAETKQVHYELIVVDNNSEDGSADAIAERFPQLRLIRLDENIGFARANNLVAKEARGELLLLLNPDTVILNGAIDKLTAFARARPEAGIWGGRTVFGDGSLNPTSCWGKFDLKAAICKTFGLSNIFASSSVLNPEGYGDWKRDTEREVDIVTGCFFMIPRESWRRLDGFDPVFVMYGEEADLCLRARRDLGARPRVTPTAEIVHYGGASEKIRSDKFVRLLKAKVSLVERHWRPFLKPLGRFLILLWPWNRYVATRLTGGSGSGVNATSHDAWVDIWRRRDEWRRGYEA